VMNREAGSDRTRMALDAMLAEYSSLRTESIGSSTNRIAVMTFTFGALSIFVGLLTTSTLNLPRVTAGVIALAFIPQMAKAGLLIWLGEYKRARRAGDWLVGLEEKINNLLGGGPQIVGWETYLKKGAHLDKPQGLHMLFPYVATVIFVLAAGYAASVLGVFLIVFQGGLRFLIPLAAYVLGWEALFIAWFIHLWRRAP